MQRHFNSSSIELICRSIAEVDAKGKAYVKSLLHATLFPCLQLQQRVYTLLHRQMFPRADARHILKKLELVPTKEEAHVKLLIGVFRHLLGRYLPEAAAIHLIS